MIFAWQSSGCTAVLRCQQGCHPHCSSPGMPHHKVKEICHLYSTQKYLLFQDARLVWSTSAMHSLSGTSADHQATSKVAQRHMALTHKPDVADG